MKRPHHHRLLRRAILLGAVTAISVAAAAPLVHAQLLLRKEKAPDDAVITRSGVSVSIDPLTGKLRQPTSEEARTLAQQLFGQYQRSAAPLAIQKTLNGMLSADLPEEYQDVAVLRLLPDGSTVVECVHGPDAASELVIRGDLPKSDDSAATPETSVAKSPVRTPQRAVAHARPKPLRKTAKLAPVSTERR